MLTKRLLIFYISLKIKEGFVDRSKKMKVAVIGCRGIPNIMGGIETHVDNLYSQMMGIAKEDAVKLDITIFARKPYMCDKKCHEYNGMFIKPIFCIKKPCLENFFHTFLCVFECLRLHPDIVHLHAIGTALFAPIFRLSGAKVVYTHHGQDYNRAKWGLCARTILKFGERLGSKFSNRVIVISKYLQNWLSKEYNCKKTELIYNGVNLPAEVPNAADYLRKFNLVEKKYVFACGRFVPEKGFMDLIAAWKKVPHGDIKLVIAGKPDHNSAFSRKLVKIAEENDVVLTGHICGDELLSIYHNADLFVLPSYHEGLPIVLLEAMSHNLKIVASDIPANTEVPLPRDCFYAVGNVDELAAKITQKLGEPIDVNYREIIEKQYNWHTIAKQTLNVYKNVLN